MIGISLEERVVEMDKTRLHHIAVGVWVVAVVLYMAAVIA